MNEHQTKRLGKLLNVLNEAMRWPGDGPRMTLRGTPAGLIEVTDIDADNDAALALIAYEDGEYVLKAVQ